MTEKAAKNKWGTNRHGIPLFVFMTVLIVITVIISGGLYYYLTSKRNDALYTEQVEENLKSISKTIQVRVASSVLVNDHKKASSIMNDAFGYNAYVEQAWLVDNDSQSVFFDLSGMCEGETFQGSMKDEGLKYYTGEILPTGGVGLVAPEQEPIARLIVGYKHLDMLEARQRDQMIDYSKTILNDINQKLATGQLDQAKVILSNMLLNDRKVRSVRIIDKSNKIIMELDRDDDNELVIGREGLEVEDNNIARSVVTGSRKPVQVTKIDTDTNDQYYIVNMPLLKKDRNLGVVQFEYSIQDYVLAKRNQRKSNAVIIILFIICGIIGGIAASLWLTRPIRKLTNATKLAAGGDLEQSVETSFSGKEIIELADNFNNLILQRRIFEDSLKSSEKQMRELARKVIRTQEEERIRLAREIHDEIGHRMTATSYIVESMKKRLAPDDPEIAAIEKHLAGLAGELMRIYKGLSPIVIDKLGLSTAIRAYVNDASNQMDIAVNTDLEDIESADLTHTNAVNIYRIFQEAMTNIYRHSEAENVDIKLRKTHDRIVLKIIDDGKGIIDNNGSSTTLGIAGMRERSLAMAGDFIIESQPGKGTSIEIVIPMNGAATGNNS